MTKAEKFKQLTCTESVRSNLRSSSVRAATFTGGASFADFALRIGSTAVLARLVIPEHFGLVMMVTAVIAVADQLKELGLSAATVQQKEITHEEVTNLFWINVVAGLFLALVVCLLSPFIANYYREPRLTAITCLLSTNFVFGGLMVQHQALLTRKLRLGHTSMVRLGTSVVSTILAIFLAWKGFGYWALVWREISKSVLLAAGMWFCFRWIPGMPSRNTDVRGMVGFGTNLTLAHIIGSLSAGVDRFMIGRFMGAGAVAIYRQAYQLIVAPTDQLLSPIYQVAQPGLCMLQGDPIRFQRFFKKVLTMVCMIIMPLSLFVAVYSREVTIVLLGPKWMACAPIFQILSFGTFIKQAAGSTAFPLVAQGGSKAYLVLGMLQNVTFVIAVAVGVHWGIRGVAVADVVTTWILLAPRLHYSLKGSPFTMHDFFSTITRPAFASVSMAGILLGLRFGTPNLSPLLALVFGGCAAGVVFFGIWLLLPGSKTELKDLISDLRSALQQKKIGIKIIEPVANR
jgi:O-antigen/teichoic acid export membrane protein